MCVCVVLRQPQTLPYVRTNFCTDNSLLFPPFTTAPPPPPYLALRYLHGQEQRRARLTPRPQYHPSKGFPSLLYGSLRFAVTLSVVSTEGLIEIIERGGLFNNTHSLYSNPARSCGLGRRTKREAMSDEVGNLLHPFPSHPTPVPALLSNTLHPCPNPLPFSSTLFLPFLLNLFPPS